jgi:cyclic beta-1,2-glucan synthetase
VTPERDFFNGFGGFSKNGLEYIIHLKQGMNTPAPWINVIANPSFGFHVSESGASSTWSLNSRENQITPWSNDPVCDPTGECFYIFDKKNKKIWCPTMNPIRIKDTEYLIRHGQGFSQFESEAFGIGSLLTQFVHTSLSVKISKLFLVNNSNEIRELSITSYIEWVLGFSRSQTYPYLLTELNEITGAIFCSNPLSLEFGSRISFATFLEGNDSFTGNRKEFLGRNGSPERPYALLAEQDLSGKLGAGLDPCSAIQKNIVLQPGEKINIIFILGQAEDRKQAQDIIKNINFKSVESEFIAVRNEWDKILNKIQVETPDQSFNIMINRWLLYQNTTCRLWARSAFYQSGGAFGFRDQLQDSMAMIWTRPDLTKAQIILASSRQFLEGDVQHWWQVPTGRGVRTHISDDLLWLPYVVLYYLKITDDISILEFQTPFINGPLLPIEKEDDYYTPEISDEKVTIYEHCARAIDHSLTVGVHGLPLMGGGDWNDGMNRVGHEGKGESVWLAWFLLANLSEFSNFAKKRGEISRFEKWTQYIIDLKKAIETDGWDGGWYRRAFFDDGTALGSAISKECQIDSLTQSWSAISGAGDLARANLAMDAVEKFLIKSRDKIILLFTPAFDLTPLDPGYIKGYLPGVRENGGQYSHAAIWCILAYAKLNKGQKAVELFSMLNPINHNKSIEEVNRYKVEPYVLAADVYSESPHNGRGGWTWYTGSSAWMYRAGVETILGFNISGNKLVLDPHIHSDWKSYKINYLYMSTIYEIEVQNPNGLTSATVPEKEILLIDDGSKHSIKIILR